MGSDLNLTPSGDGKTVPLTVPAEMVGFIQRILQLGAGIHLVQVVKLKAGKGGLVAWTVREGKLERPRGRPE